MDENRQNRAPDYTAACIVMFGVNLAWILLLLFALWGLVGAICASLALNHTITLLSARRYPRGTRRPARRNLD